MATSQAQLRPNLGYAVEMIGGTILGGTVGFFLGGPVGSFTVAATSWGVMTTRWTNANRRAKDEQRKIIAIKTSEEQKKITNEKSKKVFESTKKALEEQTRIVREEAIKAREEQTRIIRDEAIKAREEQIKIVKLENEQNEQVRKAVFKIISFSTAFIISIITYSSSSITKKAICSIDMNSSDCNYWIRINKIAAISAICFLLSATNTYLSREPYKIKGMK